MRCLQCGKNVPLLKRLAESEFCSEAHRRDYQQEYSQLALSRLLQSKPAEAQVQQVKPPPPTTASAPAIVEPPAVTAATAKPGVARAWAEKAHPATTPSAPSAIPNGMAKSHPPPAISKKAVPLPAVSQPAASQPATAKSAVIQKPAPAGLRFARVAAPDIEHAFTSLAPNRPRRKAGGLPTELPQGRAIALESRLEIADSTPHPIECKLDLREVSRTTPKIALDLRIVPPESLEIGSAPLTITESQPLTIPVAPAAPAQTSLWIGPPYAFAGQPISLTDFANVQFSKSGFETPAVAGFAKSTGVEPLPSKPQPPPHERDASGTKSQSAALTPTVRIPEPELNPLPVNSPGIAPGRAKPVPVFGPAPVRAGTVQIPQPTGLPLRPVMVLGGAASITGVKKRESDVPSLRSDPGLTGKPSLQQSRSSAPLSSEPNPGLPEPRIQTMAGGWVLRMRKLLAPLAGAVVLGTCILFLVGKQSDAGLKSQGPTLTHAELGSEWMANFAPDARRQRRVSLLRSSAKLSAYRLDFQSSIQTKALGWVYRAKDSKNFYVSKIELQKPGQSDAYALVHYAVIDGVEQSRERTPLHVTVPLGGLYKIRFDAVGNRFVTWVQGEQVEQWTDSRLSSGGAGLYSEGAERSTLHGDFVVTPLLK
jgi:hypothetical protein